MTTISTYTAETGCNQVRSLIEQGRKGQAWELLLELVKAFPTHAPIYRLQGSILNGAGYGEQAIQAYRQAIALLPGDSQAHIGLAHVLHRLGQLPEALSAYRHAVLLQTIQQLQAQDSPCTHAFDTQKAQEHLWQLLTYLAQSGIHAFPTSGTLLGLEREGKLLPFDKDIDIGLPFSQMEQAEKRMEAAGWQRVVNMAGLVNPQEWHHPEGVAVDLCGYAPEAGSDQLLAGFWFQSVTHPWSRITCYPAIHLQQRTGPAGVFWYPTEPESMLLQPLYGPHWRQPDPDFDTVIAAHNLRTFSTLTQCYAWGRIYQNWVLGRFAKVHALIKHCLKWLPDDILLQQAYRVLTATLPPSTVQRVLALGVFDLFHIGHLRYLQQAQQLGGYLLVGITPDAMCHEKKGKWPAIDQQQRQEIIAGVRGVDAVCLVRHSMDDTEAAAQWIAGLGINIVACGGEWQGSPRWQALEPQLRKQGIRVHYLSATPKISSTAITARIRSVSQTA